MERPPETGDYGSGDHGRWLWLGAFTALAMLSLSGGKLLLAAGMLLLGVFAFFNNPLRPTRPRMGRPAPAVALSWACGLFGVAMVMAAAARTWL